MSKHARDPRWITAAAAVLTLAFSQAPARAQQEPAVLSGVQYLRQHVSNRPGEAAMIALGLTKAEVPHNDAAVQSCLARIRGRFGSGGAYSPEMGDGAGTYEAAASIMALATED